MGDCDCKDCFTRSYVSNLQTPRNLSNRAIHKIPIRPKCLRKWRTKKLTLSKPVVSKKSYRSCRKLSHCLQNFSSSELKSKACLMEKHYSINHIRYANEIFDPKIELINKKRRSKLYQRKLLALTKLIKLRKRPNLKSETRKKSFLKQIVQSFSF